MPINPYQREARDTTNRYSDTPKYDTRYEQYPSQQQARAYNNYDQYAYTP